MPVPDVPCTRLPASNYDSSAGRLVQDALSHLELQFEQGDTLGDYQPDPLLSQLLDNTTLVVVATYPEDYAARRCHGTGR